MAKRFKSSADRIRIKATKGRGSWLRFLFFSAIDGISSKSSDWTSSPPGVVVINSRGDVKVLKSTSTYEEAESEASKTKAALELLGFEAWCHQHNISPEFFEPD